MYCLWQVSIWQLQKSPVSCSAWTIHPEGRIPPLSHPAPATGFGGRCVQPCSAIHPGASQSPFLADYREKLGFPELCSVLEFSLGSSRAAFSSWRMGAFLCHCSWVALPTGGHSQGLSPQSKPKIIPGNSMVSELWISPGAIFRILYQFIQGESSLIGCESDNNSKYW